MSEQPPAQPPNNPTGQPTTPQAGGTTPTQPMPPVQVAPTPGASQPNMWRRATATTGRRVGLGVAAFALVALLFFGFVVTSLLVLRHHNDYSLVGDRQGMHYMDQGGPGNGHGFGNRNKDKGNRDDHGNPDDHGNGDDNQGEGLVPRMPVNPGNPRGLGGLGNLFGAGALHGTVTAPTDGSVQALLFQRGEVIAVSATSITLKSSDGFVGTYVLNASTKANGAAPAKGAQALVLARASDKVALRLMAGRDKGAAEPNS